MTFRCDMEAIQSCLKDLPTHWDGKECVLELKKADYHWKQMEWWAFYFEWLCRGKLASIMEFPGDKFGRTSFDAKRSCNWDFKAKAIKSDNHRAVVNDCAAVEKVVARDGVLGLAIALCDVEYNDVDRAFQRWHTELKGGFSEFEKDRMARTSVSRYRKTRIELREILFLGITPENLPLLDRFSQGRNSNGNPREKKYMLDLECIDPFFRGKIDFAE